MQLEKPIKNIGKVAIIIPTKGNVNMLYECVKSFYDHCNQDYFEIFIADTGSTDSEKEWIQNNILNLGFINFIEYDYYNFAKINNDVVKNHLNDDYEFILFSKGLKPKEIGIITPYDSQKRLVTQKVKDRSSSLSLSLSLALE